MPLTSFNGPIDRVPSSKAPTKKGRIIKSKKEHEAIKLSRALAKIKFKKYPNGTRRVVRPDEFGSMTPSEIKESIERYMKDPRWGTIRRPLF